MMASTFSVNTPQRKYDVFLSFRAIDTRDSFVSFLHRELMDRNGIETFIDDEASGEEAIFTKIEESSIALIIFSKNYADSRWCLRVLLKILECKKTKGQIVIPVFYRVDPKEVLEHRGSFGDGPRSHEQESASEEVQLWKGALKDLANLTGWVSSVVEPDIKLVDQIVDDIQKKLPQMHSYDIEGFVGIESHVKGVQSLLSIGSPIVLSVGIWGMLGIGKTTIAEVVYNQISYQFEGHCFISNVREEAQRHEGLVCLRQKIVTEVLGEKDGTTPTLSMLRHKKVLIILDDVSSPKDFQFLVGDIGLLGKGSRIIVTSRDRQVLINGCEKDKIYEVKDLDKCDALELFSLHAFKNQYPIEEYKLLSKRVVSYVKGIPLVLEVLGCSLYKRSIGYWESKLVQLRSSRGENIFKIFGRFYDDELDQTEKQTFLDIACFFRKCNRGYVLQTLDPDGRYGINRLAHLCLIKISDNQIWNQIWMHDVLQKLGREIVYRENYLDPGKCSRLWKPKEAYHVLKNHQILHSMPAILPNSIDQLECLTKLASLPNSIDLLECLTKLVLKQCLKLASFPNSIGHWKCLTKLHLYSCSNIESLPNSIGELKCLTNLVVKQCYKLVSLPNSIGQLKCLTELDLKQSYKLASLPNSICDLESLKILTLSGCSNLEQFPVKCRSLEAQRTQYSTYHLDLLRCLTIVDCAKKTENPSIGSWVWWENFLFGCNKQPCKLTKLILIGCERLKDLPELPSTLHWLNVMNCISLESVSSTFKRAEKEYEAASEYFQFANCHKLHQNSCIKIMDEAQLRILRMATSLFNQEYRESGKRIGIRYCVPGSQVPEWFMFKNASGSSLENIKPPAHCCSNEKFLGFAFCAVLAVKGSCHDKINITCESHIITEGKCASFRIKLESEHVFIWYEFDRSGNKSNYIFNNASFKFYLGSKKHMVLKCGIHPLFAQDNEKQHALED